MFDSERCYFSFGSNRSKGVGIIVLNDNIKVEKFHLDTEGRLIYIDINYNNVQFRIVNIYAPNNDDDRIEFFDDLYPILLCNKHLILGGDFNCVLNTQLDKIGGNPSLGTKGSDNLRNIISDFKLTDCFRFLYPNTIQTTWTGNTNVACRLDRIYISRNFCKDISFVKNIPFGHSDHDIVLVQFNVSNTNNITFGKSYWKFNNSLLQDKTFVKNFTKYWTELIDGIDFCLEMWDCFKEIIKKYTINYCKKKAKVKREILQHLQKSYYQMQFSEQKNPGQFIDRVREIKNQIKEFQLQNYTGSIIRSKAEILDNQEKPSKFFFQQEIKRAKKKTITKIITESSHTCTNSGDILEAFKEFYSKLYTDEGIDQDLVNEFLEHVPKLSNEDSARCEGQITKEEIFTALRDMENNRSPGPDGLTKEFYCTFKDILIEPLLKVIQNAFTEGHLSETQKLSYITLICKDPDNSESVKNYRPISLLNLDYKIISKVITNRVKSVVEHIVHPDQTCAVPGRTIFDNLHLMRNIIDYCEQKQAPVAFISLDQEKAFDRVNYKFLFQTLSAYNFGPSLIRWIKTLYNNVCSSVIVNNHISDPITLERGVRQGCSLSPLLYILVLEPFAIKIREDEQISGVKLPGTSKTSKISLYADDSLAICTSDPSVRRVLYWCAQYGRASGAKLNLQKTKGIWMGKWKSRSDHPFGISWVENCKILGIRFGNNITQDDIWQPVLTKFINILNLWKQRRLSFVEKSNVVKIIACSKIWYIGSVFILPQYYLKQFERTIFQFLWPSKMEPIKRLVAQNYKKNGGLDIVNIETKLQSLRLKHLQNIVQSNSAKYTFFSVYWVGYNLRKFQPLLARNNIPHSEVLSDFYRQCIKDFNYFLCIKNDNYIYTFGNMSVKQYYTILLENIVIQPRIVSIFPTINFQEVFKNLYNPFIDRFARDITFRLIHDTLPVSYFMYYIGLNKEKNCVLCKNRIETITHLFYECSFVKPLLSLLKNWLNTLSGNKFQHLNFSHIRFHTVPDFDKTITSLCLYLISLYNYIVWRVRCINRLEKNKYNSDALILRYINSLTQRIQCDFYRFSIMEFRKYWCTNDLFCTVENEKLKLHISV